MKTANQLFEDIARLQTSILNLEIIHKQATTEQEKEVISGEIKEVRDALRNVLILYQGICFIS